jgi:hypothetical protein
MSCYQQLLQGELHFVAAERVPQGRLRMAQQITMVVVGVVLVLASVLAKGISYGMPPHGKKPTYPVTRTLRIVLFSVGLLSLSLGLSGLVRG